MNINDIFASDGGLKAAGVEVKKFEIEESSPFVRALAGSSSVKARSNSYDFASSSPCPRYVRGYDKINSSPASFLDDDPEQADIWNQVFTAVEEGVSDEDSEMAEVEGMLGTEKCFDI